MAASPYDQRITAGMGITPGQHSFAEVPSTSIQRSVFNRSSGLKTAFDSGYLIPIYTDECLPGDTMALKTSCLVRMTTPIFPVMENIYLDIFYFAIPYRLVWDNFVKMMGERNNPSDSIVFNVPIFDEVQVTIGSLSDYLGIPPSAAATLDFVSLWHRAYNLCYNEWFRDQNLQNSVTVDTGNGPDNLANYVLLRRGRRHDYFTSCLPFTQKGDPVTLPLGTTAPVVGTGDEKPTFEWTNPVNTGVQYMVAAGTAGVVTVGGIQPNANMTMMWSDPKLVANLSAATAATINDIRYAFQIQKLLERDARGGSRYIELVRSHFGVISPDARLQRPEYLGGGTTRVNVHPVPNTNFGANPATATPSASLSAFAVAQGDGMGFMKSFTEHTLILGIANIRCDLTYQQGIHRKFSRRTRYEFYWPELAHLGEGPVFNKEIFADGSATDELVFGYQERWAEYRYGQSITTGHMRSTSTIPLDQWHLGLEFGSVPALNASFIESNEPFNRVLTITTQPQFYGDFNFNVRHARPMPTFSVPGFVDHF